jgi:hypothetical protein
MTPEQMIAEVAAQPDRIKAFTTFMDCLKIEADDAFLGNGMPTSVKSKYDSVFSTASDKAHEILNAIENGKPHLETLSRAASPSDPRGPFTPVPQNATFVDKPATVTPSKAVPIPAPGVINPATGTTLAPATGTTYPYNQNNPNRTQDQINQANMANQTNPNINPATGTTYQPNQVTPQGKPLPVV